MSLDPSALATKLYATLSNTTDKDGNPTEPTDLIKAYANGYCACLQAGLVNNPPGTVLAVAEPTPGPVEDGEAEDGVMVLVPTLMTAVTLPAFPPESAAKLMAENTAVITYVMTNGLVSFATGDINGVATNTPITPGILTLGEGTGGEISGLDGGACTSFVQAQVSGLMGPDMEPFYTALMDYTKDNAEVTYAPGTIEGSFSAGGGPMTAGVGVGGTIA